MSLILFGAELGPKADPTTTTYTPRPEWYFFFLFELLRVVKPPALVFIATIGIPTLCLVLLILLPFIDRNPERHPLKRPIATFAGITTIVAMAYLTLEGALAGPPTEIDLKTTRPVRARQERDGVVRLPGLPPVGENGNAGPGPNLTEIGARLPARGDRAHADQPHRADAVVPQLADAEPEAVQRARRVPRLAQGRQ